jgi:signal peptide peptidase SppA
MTNIFTKLIPLRFRKKKPIVHVLRLEGALVSGRSLRGGQLNLVGLDTPLKKAFKKGISAVALDINCPGGSPVQSALIADRIRALATKNKIPVYAFCEDVAASGGYWIACAADEIYADQNSIVGSIGVIAGGFGFPKALAKLGVERRVHTAGESKSTNDPFKPESAKDVAKLKELLVEMHDSFKGWVRSRRGTKLSGKEKDLFNGSYWTGSKAKALGLIDGIGHREAIMTAKFGEKVEFKSISLSQGWGLRRFGLDLASQVPEAAFDALENRALWQRFGL